MAKKETIKINPKEIALSWWFWGIIALISYVMADYGFGIIFGFIAFISLLISVILLINHLSKGWKTKKPSLEEEVSLIRKRLGWIIFWLIVIASGIWKLTDLLV